MAIGGVDIGRRRVQGNRVERAAALQVFAGVIGLLGAVGDIEEWSGNKFAVTLGGETETLHRHGSAKDLDADEVMSLRKLLASHGIDPA